MQAVAEPDGAAAVTAFFAAIGPSQRGVPPATVRDDAIASTLMSWQRRTVEWAVGCELLGEDAESGVRGGVIAEEMGLGKTLEVMALALSNPPEGAALDRLAGPAHHPLRSGPLWPRTNTRAAVCGSCRRRIHASETIHCSEATESAAAWVCCQACLLPLRASTSRTAAGKRQADHAAEEEEETSTATAPAAKETSGAKQQGSAAPGEAAEGTRAPKRPRVQFSETVSAANSDHASSSDHASGSGQASSSGQASARRLVLRIQRPLSETIARLEAAAVAAAAAPPLPPPPPPRCMATLVVTPATILPQWLQELQQHSPRLAARTLVYDGVGGAGGGAQGAAAAARVLAAMDQAWLVLTTFKVLQAETWYEGVGAEEVPRGYAARRPRCAKRQTPRL